ncbi:hypothetical protein [Hyphomonas sp.]|jgi:CBS domain-containing protein|uniref:hypothetical protein n=1 Tax=Hyphomonas sp. TaxID=87 RepID=UPI00262656CD|nr:hypothetical protein [Hyphomonas sp.]MDF1807106.1 hypothetical protein [Hyphomonas sp.]
MSGAGESYTSGNIPPDDRGLEGLQVVHAGLPVEMIMTPRPFFSCRLDETCRGVKERNAERYSFLPVMNGERVLGLLDARPFFDAAAPDVTVEKHYHPLSEQMLIGADASIWQFLRTADQVETRLVVKGHSVAGLVTLSDLHKLPVRTALFAALTNLEVCMTTLIGERLSYDGANWLEHLAAKRRDLLASQEKRARANDEFINRLLLTQFCDKREIIAKASLVDLPPDQLRQDLKEAERLRNYVAHSNDFAQDDLMAHEVCKTARSIEGLIMLMQRKIAFHIGKNSKPLLHQGKRGIAQ